MPGTQGKKGIALGASVETNCGGVETQFGGAETHFEGAETRTLCVLRKEAVRGNNRYVIPSMFCKL